MSFKFDHIAIGADNLEQGVEFIKQKFGIDIPFGGTHDQMGTHNHLMQIGGGIFLELIAINPNASAPKAPQKRWFNLDNQDLQQDLKHGPKLLTWVACTANIRTELNILSNAIGHIDMGKVHKVSRGDLNWQISIPENGKLIEHGLFPTLIEWPDDQSPAANMADLGIKLKSFTLTHPEPELLSQQLKNHQASEQFKLNIRQGYYHLSATFNNAQGDLIDI